MLQAELEMQQLQLDAQPITLQLHALKNGEDMETGLGELHLSAWLAPQTDMQPNPSSGAHLA